MALPPGFIDDLRARLTLSDIAGRKVIWDTRKSNPAKGDFWAPCPFHQEKTPSFHVDDRKGYYYCFGCHEKGDMVSFVRGTENVSFIEAVAILAREAGVEMPAETRDPRAAEKRDRLARLTDVMDQAARSFQLSFRSAAGQAARAYADSRGLGAETLAAFEIGYAPNARTALAASLAGKGLTEDAVEAGLLIRPDDGGAPYDRFRDRLMFPIRDARGRCIAFGGRAMAPDARAKYLNSPETPLFHKSRVLYNHGPARAAAGKTGTLIVAEGYMDVIALAAAGFGHAVAPLGTAITEDQLRLMWQIADEPVIALDGDKAGLRAAERLIDLALPLLAPGKSLRFCVMPEGQDPDDLIRNSGPSAMGAALDTAIPLAEMLWRRETGRAALDTPERRAALDASLRKILGTIGDAAVRGHYAEDLRARRAALFAPPPAPRRTYDSPAARGTWRPAGRGARNAPTKPAPETLRSGLARAAGRDDEARIREAAILLIALRNPAALDPIEGLLESLPCTVPEMEAIQNALLDALASGAHPITHITARLGEDPCALLGRIPQARAHPFARPDCDPERVREVLVEAIERHRALLAHSTEMHQARRDLAGAEDERWTHSVLRANLEREAHEAAAADDTTDADDDGAGLRRLFDARAWHRRPHLPEKPET